MKYKDYLKTEHWKNFRKNIYAKRKNCQNCGTSKKTLNLHHKNYNNLWKETNTDVIILCQECHYRFHKKKKWIKLLKSRDELDFTRVSDNAVKMNKIYSIKSKEERMSSIFEGLDENTFSKINTISLSLLFFI